MDTSLKNYSLSRRISLALFGLGITAVLFGLNFFGGAIIGVGLTTLVATEIRKRNGGELPVRDAVLAGGVLMAAVSLAFIIPGLIAGFIGG